MISLTCTSCRALLEIDDAFVGGVCRCQHCGAIQTVPSHPKKGAAEKKVKAQKTLYKKSVRNEAMPSSGLDQLAQVVSSSGLSSGRLQEIGGPPRRSSRRLVLVVAGCAVGVAVLVLSVLVLLPATRSQSAATSVVLAAPSLPAVVESAPLKASPNFCGVPLDVPAVIYLLDRGGGTQELFSYLTEAAYRSAATLGSGRKFQIIFWDNGSEDAYPLTGPTYATEPNIAAARRSLEDIIAHGQSDVGPPLVKATGAAPSVIVLATGKGAQLDESFVQQVMGIVKDRPIKVHTFDLGATDVTPALKTIAERTGGQSKAVSAAELKAAMRD